MLVPDAEEGGRAEEGMEVGEVIGRGDAEGASSPLEAFDLGMLGRVRVGVDEL